MLKVVRLILLGIFVLLVFVGFWFYRNGTEILNDSGSMFTANIVGLEKEDGQLYVDCKLDNDKHFKFGIVNGDSGGNFCMITTNYIKGKDFDFEKNNSILKMKKYSDSEVYQFEECYLKLLNLKGLKVNFLLEQDDLKKKEGFLSQLYEIFISNFKYRVKSKFVYLQVDG